MALQLPVCEVVTDSYRAIGLLYIQTGRVVVLLNNLHEEADLGPLLSIRKGLISPEADILIIPARDVKTITELELTE